MRLRGIEQRECRSEYIRADFVNPPVLIEQVLDMDTPGGGERRTSWPFSGLRGVRHAADACNEADHTNSRAHTSRRHPQGSNHRTPAETS